MVAETIGMEAKKPKNQPAGAKRKPHHPVRIRRPIYEVAEKRAAMLAQDATQWINDAVRMRLEAEGAWPPVK